MKIYLLFLFGISASLSLHIPAEQGPHGGMLKAADEYFIEMKSTADTSLSAYLLTKKLKTVSSKGISAEAKFFFTDSTALDVRLKADTLTDAFTARAAPGFYACKITFLVLGKEVSARFEKQSQIARENK